MCMESGTYYYHTYDCRQIIAIHLFNENLDTAEIKTYPFQRKQKSFMKTDKNTSIEFAYLVCEFGRCFSIKPKPSSFSQVN